VALDDSEDGREQEESGHIGFTTTTASSRLGISRVMPAMTNRSLLLSRGRGTLRW
jgi:hypothetical protein